MTLRTSVGRWPLTCAARDPCPCKPVPTPSPPTPVVPRRSPKCLRWLRPHEVLEQRRNCNSLATKSSPVGLVLLLHPGRAPG